MKRIVDTLFVLVILGDIATMIMFVMISIKILDLLLPALQATRNLSDLVELEYREDRELVYAKFASGNQKIANVAMDSGTALIRDVIGQII